MNHRSLAFRLGAWYTLLLSAIFALVGIGTFYGLKHDLRSNLRDSLSHRSMQVEQILDQAPVDATDSTIAREIETRVAPEFNNRFVRVTREPDMLVYRSGAPADRSFDPSLVSAITRTSVSNSGSPVTAIMGGQHLMIRATPVSAPSGNYLVELGVSIDPIDAVLHRLLDLLAVLLPVLIVCAAGGGYWLVNRALRPVDRLSQTAEQMSLQNLTLRLPVVPTGDALERLSISLNTMLGRLRDSVQTSRRFLADASHELRTPLTVIKGELQGKGRARCHDALSRHESKSYLYVLPHVILLPVASSAMLPEAFPASPSDLIASRKTESQSDAGGGRDPGDLRLER